MDIYTRIGTRHVQLVSIQFNSKTWGIRQSDVSILRQRLIFEELPKKAHDLVRLWTHDKKFCQRTRRKADLKVIKLKSWDTLPGYFKVSPSPNIANFETALMYNGMCLLEGTNISEGRGTETPFLLFGAPWMNSSLILKDLIQLSHFHRV